MKTFPKTNELIEILIKQMIRMNTFVSAEKRSMKTPESKISFTSLMRSKTFTSSRKAHRRMSCKEIGGGDCNGWLLMKVRRPLQDKWRKLWFVLRGGELFYYNDPNDDSYVGRFNLAGFSVSPVEDQGKSNKYAFGVHHQDLGSYFMASDRQQDMAKWMSYIQIAIASLSASKSKENGHHSGEEEDLLEMNDNPFDNGTAEVQPLPDHVRDAGSLILPTVDRCAATLSINLSSDAATESSVDGSLHGDDECGSAISGVSTPRENNLSGNSFRKSCIGIKYAIDNTRCSNLLRIQQLKSAAAASDAASSRHHHLSDAPQPSASKMPLVCFDQRRLYMMALQRTLKDKEMQLAIIDDLFLKVPIDSDALAMFKQLNVRLASTLCGDSVGGMDGSHSDI